MRFIDKWTVNFRKIVFVDKSEKEKEKASFKSNFGLFVATIRT